MRNTYTVFDQANNVRPSTLFLTFDTESVSYQQQVGFATPL